MSKLVSNIGNLKVETFDLSQEQHDIVVDMINRDVTRNGNYTIEEPDMDMIDCWIDNLNDNSDFLREAKENCADMYILVDHLGNFDQIIGDIAVTY